MLKVDPYKTIEYKIGEIIFFIRGLTAREYYEILPYDVVFNNAEVHPATMSKIVEKGLIGWKNAPIDFNKRNQIANLDLLEGDEIMSLFSEIMKLSKVEVEIEKK